MFRREPLHDFLRWRIDCDEVPGVEVGEAGAELVLLLAAAAVFEPPMWRALVIVNVIKTPTKKKHDYFID